ncbi:alkaline phosphatase D family protein [Streptomyces apocyni]|uniref:alkaline phosphatase D family protein n=1 Tax=Streptomyces apocyni TaxID=2654677 RepID=UPI0012EAD61B|nr:alkaline phosphatase D family protein [Streptomyces apocyni]
MARLRLGPLLRYVDQGAATVWVEAGRPCTATVRCADGAGGESRTFQIGGHHYALIPVTGLTPDTETAYEVLLDGRRVWPLNDPALADFPPSTIRTPAHPTTLTPTTPTTPTTLASTDELRISFGSCRWAVSPTGRWDPMGPDALDTLAVRLSTEPDAERPDLLVLLGDQVYADKVSRVTRRRLAARRDLREPPGAQVADYDEYCALYDESWRDPEVRWLLSTVPSCLIFDDHDVIDDWHTSAAWLAEMRTTPWWHERVVSGLMSYWVYQHLGNLPPDELATDPLYAAVRATPDGTEALRAFAAASAHAPESSRWSYRRDLGRTRLLMVDTRVGRVLEESRRAMLDPAEERWLREQALDGGPGSYDHLLIGTSLPWLLPHLVHDAEAWSAALTRGERGGRWARFAENLRRRADLEHWPAFPASFDALTGLIAEAGGGARPPASVCVLSGDVHHAYIAEPVWRDGTGPAARVLQLTCSPLHNSIPAVIRLGFRFGWSRAGRALGRRFARHGRTKPAAVDWRRTGGPWFGNQLMTLTLRGRGATLRLERASRSVRGGRARLRTVAELAIAKRR